jgi:hypothetical protein
MPISEGRENWIAMSGVTEGESYHQTTTGSKALSLFLKPLGSTSQPTFYFSTYSTNRNTEDDGQDMTFTNEELDSQWNWVYFGYDINI